MSRISCTILAILVVINCVHNRNNSLHKSTVITVGGKSLFENHSSQKVHQSQDWLSHETRLDEVTILSQQKQGDVTLHGV